MSGVEWSVLAMGCSVFPLMGSINKHFCISALLYVFKIYTQRLDGYGNFSNFEWLCEYCLDFGWLYSFIFFSCAENEQFLQVFLWLFLYWVQESTCSRVSRKRLLLQA